MLPGLVGGARRRNRGGKRLGQGWHRRRGLGLGGARAGGGAGAGVGLGEEGAGRVTPRTASGRCLAAPGCLAPEGERQLGEWESGAFIALDLSSAPCPKPGSPLSRSTHTLLTSLPLPPLPTKLPSSTTGLIFMTPPRGGCSLGLIDLIHISFTDEEILSWLHDLNKLLGLKGGLRGLETNANRLTLDGQQGLLNQG